MPTAVFVAKETDDAFDAIQELTNIEPDYQEEEEEEASDYGAGPTPVSESGLNCLEDNASDIDM
jgi:hypothetical protein